MFRFILSNSVNRIKLNPLLPGLSTDVLNILLSRSLMDKLCIDLYFSKYDLTSTNIFRWSCCNGRLDMSKWLIENFGNINVHAQGDYAFIHSCSNGHLDMSKWLIENFGDINVHVQDDSAFRYSCSHGHLEMSKWLIETFGDINVHA